MPSRTNLRAPATLVGSGRSGTTLVTAIMRRHRDVQAIGETGNLIFSTYYHIEKSLPLCGPGYDRESAPLAARQSIDRMLINLFPSEQPRWFHKPIMLPAVRRVFPDDASFSTWFWEAGAFLFPRGRWFTIVRNWRDVTISSMRRWGWTAEVAIRGQMRVAEMLLHPNSRVGLFVDFAELVSDPEPTVRRLLEYLGLPWDPNCLGAFDQAHAPNDASGERDALLDLRERRYGHAEEAAALTSKPMDALYARLLELT